MPQIPPLPLLEGPALSAVLAATALVALLSLFLALGSLRRAGRMLRHYRALTAGAEGRDLAALLEEATARLKASEGRLAELDRRTTSLAEDERRIDEAERAIHQLRADTADLGAQARRLSGAEGGLQHLQGRSNTLESRLQLALKRVGLIRYRAYEDTGGDQSFALALLDDANSGVVLSSLHGRGGDRVFAKPVQAGRSSYALSEEEQLAIAQAGSAGPGIGAGPRAQTREEP